ncbi:MAG TPA: hypothetical protein DDZ78_04480 [Porphyromonadaceae bacterium]|nr:hypothetical protein [Porphyromonadaceae bacterium]
MYFSLITVFSLLLFSACSNDEPGNPEEKETGTLVARISFEGKEFKSAQTKTRATGSTAIPVVSWDNVKQVQLFLYKSDGTVAFSRTVKPSDLKEKTDEAGTYTWDNVPLGTYKLGLLANAKSSSDNVVTTISGTAEELADQNVVGKKLENILIDFKGGTLPTIPDYLTEENWTPRVGYVQPAEIFTAYHESDVVISEGITKVEGNLTLKREVALLRTRFNIDEIPNGGKDKVNFDSETGFIAVQRLPGNFGLTTGTFSGGVSTASDAKKVLVGATGIDTYIKENPTKGYNPSVIIDDKYTRWNDILVLPNAALSEKKVKTDNAADDRKYFIIIAAQVKKAGYVYEDGTIAEKDGQPVYWYGIVDGVFTKNVIREVNTTLATKGYPEFPDNPQAQGGLEIIIGAPENWDSEIVSTDMNI